MTEAPLYAKGGSHVRFLGYDETMMFLMVHAGKTFFDSATEDWKNRRSIGNPLADDSGGEPTSGTSDDGKTPCL